MNFDKQITRLARAGTARVLMFGRWWDLQSFPGPYRVAFNRKRPSKSKIVRAS